MAISLDHFQNIVGVHWGDGASVLIVKLTGINLTVATYDKDGNSVSGAFGFFPDKKEDIRPSGSVNVKINGADVSEPKSGQVTFAGVYFYGDTGTYVTGSIVFFSITNEFSSEFMDTHFTLIDGELVSYTKQLSNFRAAHAGDEIISDIANAGPGLLDGLWSYTRYSLTYTSLGFEGQAQHDLFSISMLVSFAPTFLGTAVSLKVSLDLGSSDITVPCTVDVTAYPVSTVFTPKSDGSIDVSTADDDTVKPTPKWSGSGALHSSGDTVEFNKRGKV